MNWDYIGYPMIVLASIAGFVILIALILMVSRFVYEEFISEWTDRYNSRRIQKEKDKTSHGR